MSEIQNYYEVLGIPQDTAIEEIRVQYEKESKAFTDNPSKSSLVNYSAYMPLMNKSMREEYDQIIAEGSTVLTLYHNYSSAEDLFREDRITKLMEIISHCTKPPYLLHCELADYYLDLKKHSDAEKHYTIYLDKYPDDTHVQFKRDNKSYADPTVIAETHQLYLTELKEDPENDIILIEYANELRELEQCEAANKLIDARLQETISDESERVNLLSTRGFYYYDDGDREKAEEFLEKAYHIAENAENSYAGSGVYMGVSYLTDSYKQEWIEKFELLSSSRQSKQMAKMKASVTIGIIVMVVSILLSLSSVFTN